MSETQSKEGMGIQGVSFEAGVVSFSLVLDMTDRMESFCDDLDSIITAGLITNNAKKALFLLRKTAKEAREGTEYFLQLAQSEKDKAGGNGVRVVPDEAARLIAAKEIKIGAICIAAEESMRALWKDSMDCEAKAVYEDALKMARAVWAEGA